MGVDTQRGGNFLFLFLFFAHSCDHEEELDAVVLADIKGCPSSPNALSLSGIPPLTVGLTPTTASGWGDLSSCACGADRGGLLLSAEKGKLNRDDALLRDVDPMVHFASLKFMPSRPFSESMRRGIIFLMI